MATKHPAQSITWRSVVSSNVARVGWDRQRNMYVQFADGGRYLYSGVSRQRAVAMVRAKSVGRYLNTKIKPQFQAVKIT